MYFFFYFTKTILRTIYFTLQYFTVYIMSFVIIIELIFH